MSDLWIASLSSILASTMIYLTFLFSQKFSKINLFYGVFIAEENQDTDILHDITHTFRIQSSIIYVISILLSLLFLWIPNLSIFPSILCVFGYLIAYSYAHQRTKKYKDANPTLQPTSTKLNVDISFMNERMKWKRITTFLSLVPVCLALVTIIYVGINYNSIPNPMPTHWNITGEINGWSNKSFLSVFLVNIIQVGMAILLLFTVRLMFQTRAPLNPLDLEKSRHNAINYLKGMAFTVLSMNFIISSMFAYISYCTIQSTELSNVVMIGTLVLLVLTIVSILIVALVFGQQQEMDRIAAASYSPENDDNNWLWGIFYNNPNDPAIMVQKRYGIGWTFNVGSRAGKLIAIGSLAVPIVLVIISVFI